MLKEKLLILLLFCAGFFLLSSNSSFANTKKETFLGYPVIENEERIEHAIMIAMPDLYKRVLYIGELTEMDKDLAECFNNALEFGVELEITGNAKNINGYKYLVFDEETTCSHRN